jgi:hypothetical protein
MRSSGHLTVENLSGYGYLDEETAIKEAENLAVSQGNVQLFVASTEWAVVPPSKVRIERTY